jgi:hypothetical protein
MIQAVSLVEVEKCGSRSSHIVWREKSAQRHMLQMDDRAVVPEEQINAALFICTSCSKIMIGSGW